MQALFFALFVVVFLLLLSLAAERVEVAVVKPLTLMSLSTGRIAGFSSGPDCSCLGTAFKHFSEIEL